MSVRGAVDGFEGSWIAGWAIAEPDDHSCIIEVRDEAGNVVAGGRATRSRPDLAVLGFGRTSFAFRVPLRDVDVAGSFTVTADGQSLQGSPVLAGPGIFDGFTDIGDGHIDGWLTERCANPIAPRIELVDEFGTVLASTMARIDRESGDPYFIPARYFMRLPDAVIGRGPTRLRIRANGVEVGPPVIVDFSFTGTLDTLTATRCAGWLAMKQDPGREIGIEVFRDGKKVGEGRTFALNEERHRSAPRLWRSGFDIGIEPLPPAARLHSLSLRLAGTDIELFGGPFLTGSRAGMVAVAREAAHALHGGTMFDDTTGVVLRAALADYIARIRQGPAHIRLPPPPARPTTSALRLTVLVPVYRGTEITRDCIDSVLAQRDPDRDAMLLVDDCSPEPDMAALLERYAALPNVTVVANAANMGFVRSVNRGLDAIGSGDVLLLNSDTRLFPGALDELCAVSAAAPDTGTVTALSNNATIFTYPATNEPEETLPDTDWEELAAVALAENRGGAVEVPTAHGFCMLITRAMLDRVGRMNEAFGRGYGEENDFCQRGADLGFRHFAATGVLVEHRESISFGDERDDLLRANLARLAAMYPEYDETIAAHERRDPLRFARWRLHRYRLAKARGAAGKIVLVICNQLGGGTARAEQEIGTAAGYAGALMLHLSCSRSGEMELKGQTPPFRLRFAPEDRTAPAAIFAMLAECGINLVLVHQTLGFTADFIAGLAEFAASHRAVFYAHDFYPSCPRVTMIDALGRFCGGPEPGRCVRCVELAGVHEASHTDELTPAAHHALFARLLGGMAAVVTPSQDAARHLGAAFPGLKISVIPHPHLGPPFPAAARDGTATDIVLLGAIGPHKGSAELLGLARRAWLTHPELRFHVIGFTDIDDQLKQIGNVTISGKYEDAQLPGLIAASGARLALFLQVWPETFSYTLTEAVCHGLIPVVPDIGAPAERVRASRFGVVFPFPFDAVTILDTIDGIATNRIPPTQGGTPAAYATPDPTSRLQEIFGLTGRRVSEARKARPGRRPGPAKGRGPLETNT